MLAHIPGHNAFLLPTIRKKVLLLAIDFFLTIICKPGVLVYLFLVFSLYWIFLISISENILICYYEFEILFSNEKILTFCELLKCAF